MTLRPTDPLPTNAIERSVRIAAAPDIVFEFFTDAEKMLRWKGIQHQLEPHPGGVFRVNINGHDVMRGEYVEVVPYTRIVFTWGAEQGLLPIPPGGSTVEVTFTPDGDGTFVRLRHLDLPDEQLRATHVMGWDHYLLRLIVAAEGGEVIRDPWAASGTMGD
jgi:uncharacterized protein YndB with AHSA1/START domain